MVAEFCFIKQHFSLTEPVLFRDRCILHCVLEGGLSVFNCVLMRHLYMMDVDGWFVLDAKLGEGCWENSAKGTGVTAPLCFMLLSLINIQMRSFSEKGLNI